MDKTGILTEGNFIVTIVKFLVQDWSEEKVLKVMAALESESSHPLEAGILDTACQKNLILSEVSDVKTIEASDCREWWKGDKSVSYLGARHLTYSENGFRELSY
jgi:Cu2+-exporting ATPase